MLAGVEHKSVSPVFVGRVGELGALRGALTAARTGEPQALLIGGEAGVGKTRLLEEFAAEAGREGECVALGACVESGAEGLPFAPFAAVLRTLRRLLPEEFAAGAAGQEGELARLLPDLGEAPSGRSGEEGTARLFYLTARLLEHLAAERTVVLVVEDLHWADASTRRLIAYLFRTLRTGRLLVLASYRADDIHRRHPLRPLLAELDRLRTVQRLELPRFNRAEVASQLAGILAAEPDESLVDDVFTRSEGNAFFVEELTVAASSGCQTGLTDSLRDLLLVRVEALPERSQHLVRLAAEGGPTTEYALLAAVARLPETELLDALRAAVGAHILLPSADGDGYRFRHALVREAVTDDLLPGERTRIGRQFAEALAADPALVAPDAYATRLAGYWYRAHDAAKALPAVLRAAAEARRRHAYAEQFSLLERAMELWDSVAEEIRDALRSADHAEVYPHVTARRGPGTGEGPDAPLRYLHLMADATVAGRLCGQRERAYKIAKRAVRMLGEPATGTGAAWDEPLFAAWFWVQRSRVAESVGRGDGWQELHTAQELVRGLPPSEMHAEVLSCLASWWMLHRPGPEAFAAAERAVQYARMVGADDDVELAARGTLAGLRVDSGDIETGLTELREVLADALRRERPHQIGRCYVNLPSHLEGIGRSAEAAALIEEGLRKCHRYGLLFSATFIHANHAESLLSLGRWDEALRSADATAGLTGQAKPAGMASHTRAVVALARGDLTTAVRELALARSRVGSHGAMPQHALPLATARLGIAAAEGRILDARAELRAAAEPGFPPGTQRYAWPLLVTAATVESDARGLPGTEEGRADFLALLRHLAKNLVTFVPVCEAHAVWVRAELRRAEARDTVADWTEAHRQLLPLERPWDLARVELRYAEALLADSGARPGPGRTQAAELLRSARATARRLGARPLAEGVDLLARRARLSLSTRPGAKALPQVPTDPAEALGLTRREREVLRLLVAGRTNRHIAAELFISPKTASVHVSHILAKLEVSSRGEAAAVAHRLRLVQEEQRDQGEQRDGEGPQGGAEAVAGTGGAEPMSGAASPAG
ncbi:AAA family ATPase [Streptomyces sp. NPDC058372]|uniref:helix-turn-helix transcriptional regulator n=1 Tax=Streptomyces sp. NPDC058372 TaxID=3346464 RepID=UPI00365A2FA7